MQPTIYTVGHSTHPWDRFAQLLADHRVSLIADVRSSPYSRFNPQFNRETLARQLSMLEIEYRFMGDQLGARPTDAGCYDDGRVSYDRLAGTTAFQTGLNSLLSMEPEHRVCLLCAEKDPLTCHRAVLVAPHLVDRGSRIRHILADGAIETQSQMLIRLRDMLGLPAVDLFRDEQAILAEALAIQAKKIAYVAEAGGTRPLVTEVEP
jgi:uncharacterized protein (DUF488 family)